MAKSNLRVLAQRSLIVFCFFPLSVSPGILSSKLNILNFYRPILLASPYPTRTDRVIHIYLVLPTVTILNIRDFNDWIISIEAVLSTAHWLLSEHEKYSLPIPSRGT